MLPAQTRTLVSSNGNNDREELNDSASSNNCAVPGGQAQVHEITNPFPYGGGAQQKSPGVLPLDYTVNARNSSAGLGKQLYVISSSNSLDLLSTRSMSPVSLNRAPESPAMVTPPMTPNFSNRRPRSSIVSTTYTVSQPSRGHQAYHHEQCDIQSGDDMRRKLMALLWKWTGPIKMKSELRASTAR